ncbi:MAG: hypothetical protein ACAH95_17640 [Fimbriimonas sp.]
MPRELLSGNGIQMGLDADQGVIILTLELSGLDDRAATGRVTGSNLQSVLNGIRLHLSLGGWLCSFELADGDVRVEIMMDQDTKLEDTISASSLQAALDRLLRDRSEKKQPDRAFLA